MSCVGSLSLLFLPPSLRSPDNLRALNIVLYADDYKFAPVSPSV